jgi:hypothetical protein
MIGVLVEEAKASIARNRHQPERITLPLLLCATVCSCRWARPTGSRVSWSWVGVAAPHQSSPAARNGAAWKAIFERVCRVRSPGSLAQDRLGRGEVGRSSSRVRLCSSRLRSLGRGPLRELGSVFGSGPVGCGGSGLDRPQCASGDRKCDFARQPQPARSVGYGIDPDTGGATDAGLARRKMGAGLRLIGAAKLPAARRRNPAGLADRSAGSRPVPSAFLGGDSGVSP